MRPKNLKLFKKSTEIIRAYISIKICNFLDILQLIVWKYFISKDDDISNHVYYKIVKPPKISII